MTPIYTQLPRHVLPRQISQFCDKWCTRNPKIREHWKPVPAVRVGAWLTINKQAPSPCVLPRQIWYFYVKVCLCIYRREPQKLGSLWAPPTCGEDVDNHLKQASYPSVLPYEIWQLCHRGCIALRIHRKEATKMGSAGTPPQSWGIVDQIKTGQIPAYELTNKIW